MRIFAEQSLTREGTEEPGVVLRGRTWLAEQAEEGSDVVDE